MHGVARILHDIITAGPPPPAGRILVMYVRSQVSYYVIRFLPV